MLLKAEIKTTLKDIRTVVLNSDNPFSMNLGGTASAQAAEPSSGTSAAASPAPATPAVPPPAAAAPVPQQQPMPQQPFPQQPMPQQLFPQQPMPQQPPPQQSIAPGGQSAPTVNAGGPSQPPGSPPAAGPGPPSAPPPTAHEASAPEEPESAAAGHPAKSERPPRARAGRTRTARDSGEAAYEETEGETVPSPDGERDHAQPPNSKWNLLTIAGLLLWAEDAVATLGARRFQIVLDLASAAALLPVETRDVLSRIVDLVPEEEKAEQPMNVIECLVILRQLDSLVHGEHVVRLPLKRSDLEQQVA